MPLDYMVKMAYFMFVYFTTIKEKIYIYIPNKKEPTSLDSSFAEVI